MRKTCVVIDDDQSFLLVIREILKRINWIELIDSYDNPVKGATAIIKQKPDVLITDYKMPYMSGTDLIEWLEPQLILLDHSPRLIILSSNEACECDNLSVAHGFLCKKDIVDQKEFELKLMQATGLQLI